MIHLLRREFNSGAGWGVNVNKSRSNMSISRMPPSVFNEKDKVSRISLPAPFVLCIMGLVWPDYVCSSQVHVYTLY